ncbi:MAG TPA: hypothetical protein PKW95_03435 [bacterium]|nr:hypothetical protein [bacterium]
MRRLAFVDLDLTLFDYTNARKMATEEGLRRIDVSFSKPATNFVDSVLSTYGDIISDLQFPNFRKDWTAQEIFAFAILFFKNNYYKERRKNFIEILKRVDSANPSDVNPFGARWNTRKQVINEMSKCGLEHLTNDVYGTLDENKWRGLIDEASSAFSTCLFSKSWEIPGTIELLSALEKNKFEINIISEGNGKIQKDKMKYIPITPDSYNLYVTGDCCNSETLLNDLWDEAIKLDKKENDGDDAIHTRSEIEYIYNEIYNFSVKSSDFYIKMLTTLLLPPNRRDRFFRSIDRVNKATINGFENAGLLLIGDRYDKDLHPAISAFDSVVSVRFINGKYKRTFVDKDLRKLDLPSPSFSAHTLKEIETFIFSLNKIPTIDKRSIALPKRIDNIPNLLKTMNLSRNMLLYDNADVT